MLDIQPEYLALLRSLFAKFIPAMKVLAYGSRIHNRSHAGSDLDLVVQDPADLTSPQKNLITLKTAITESAIPFLVDISDWAAIPETFQQEINRNYIVVWDGSSAF